MTMLMPEFFNRDPITVAQALLGKVIHVKYEKLWLKAQIVETEAYYLEDKGSHASLGWTQKRSALFMPAGTIYMYYARGGDSFNVSCKGEGNAVLIKAGVPLGNTEKALETMHKLNPIKNTLKKREDYKLCSGQTLLCKSLNLKVIEWDQQSFLKDKFYIADAGYKPTEFLQTTRLGIPKGRDEDLPYRFVDFHHANSATENPLKKRKKAYSIIEL